MAMDTTLSIYSAGEYSSQPYELNKDVSQFTPTVSEGVENNQHLFYNVSAALWKGGSAFVLFCGGILNLLIILTFNRKSLRDSVTSLLFRLLALADILVLLTHPLPAFLWFNFSIHTYTIGILSCQIFTVLNNVGKSTSAWLLVFICPERVIAVMLPHKVVVLVQKKNAWIGVGIIFFIAMMIAISGITDIYMLTWHNEAGEVIQKICKIKPKNNQTMLFKYVKYTWPYLDFIYNTGKQLDYLS